MGIPFLSILPVRSFMISSVYPSIINDRTGRIDTRVDAAYHDSDSWSGSRDPDDDLDSDPSVTDDEETSDSGVDAPYYLEDSSSGTGDFELEQVDLSSIPSSTRPSLSTNPQEEAVTNSFNRSLKRFRY